MIVGSGNDRPTPRIVLDILGVDPNLDPEPLSFQSIGEGSKQHNLAKVYSGLYEYSGHVVPYVVVVKVGKPTERSRPGNRGKRDSQLVLMHFLNKVHFGSAMNPMELEIYHQIKNIIGVNPSFYEYLLQVDADTTVDPYCLGHFVSRRESSGEDGQSTDVRLLSLDAPGLLFHQRQEDHWLVRRDGPVQRQAELRHNVAGLRVLHFALPRQGELSVATKTMALTPC